jgi:hypothetical protein
MAGHNNEQTEHTEAITKKKPEVLALLMTDYCNLVKMLYGLCKEDIITDS